MAGSGAGKGQTAKPTNALLLLALYAALLHTATAGEEVRCPVGTPWGTKPMQWSMDSHSKYAAPVCRGTAEKKPCCKYHISDDWYNCTTSKECSGFDHCEPQTKNSVNGLKLCCPRNYPENEKRKFIPSYEDEDDGLWKCWGMPTKIVCPILNPGTKEWIPQKEVNSKLYEVCCKYNADRHLEYRVPRPDEQCTDKDCVPEKGKRCCANADGLGGFVSPQPSANANCPPKRHPQCPVGKKGSVKYKDCFSGCCVYDENKGFSCEPTTKGKCEGKNGQKACMKELAKADLHCCPLDDGGFEGNMKCCPDLFKDSFVKVEGKCPEMGCPTEVARQPSREDTTKARGNSAWKRGDCCVKVGHETSKWARGSQCKTPVGKEGDVCKPKANQKCCFHTEGKKLTAVEITKDCEMATKPKCPKGDGRGKPASCESGCCVYDYATNQFGCVGKGPDGQCPPAKEKEQTCTAGRGKNDACCAAVKSGKIVGGFDSENAGKCASPIIKCGKAAGAEPEPCADGTFKCCFGNRCSKDCSAAEERVMGDKCTPVTTTNDFTKCCVNEYGDGYVKLPSGKACPEKKAPFGCPLEVAEEPETKTCGRVRGQCCVLEGPGKANCASGDRCEEDEGETCQPDSDHKCCLSPNGKALLIRKKADPCPAKPPLQCKDRKAAKIAECEEKEETEKEACKKVVEKCLVDEGVSKAGAAGGKDCEEAWAECERSQTGAAEAHGPSLRLLAPATLLLLLPH